MKFYWEQRHQVDCSSGPSGGHGRLDIPVRGPPGQHTLALVLVASGRPLLGPSSTLLGCQQWHWWPGVWAGC